MATFPALIPSGRTFTPGEYGQTTWRSMGGRSSRSRHSNIITNQRLRLTFLGLDQAGLVQILGHWINRRGRALTFGLPPETFSGTADPAVFTPAGYAWRYVARPAVDDVPCGLHDVTVELVLELV
jgi:hypothetical protein